MNIMEKKWLVLLTILVALSLVVNLFYLNAFYNIAENDAGLRGKLGQTAEGTDGLSKCLLDALNKYSNATSEARDKYYEDYENAMESFQRAYDSWKKIYYDPSSTLSQKKAANEMLTNAASLRDSTLRIIKARLEAVEGPADEEYQQDAQDCYNEAETESIMDVYAPSEPAPDQYYNSESSSMYA